MNLNEKKNQPIETDLENTSMTELVEKIKTITIFHLLKKLGKILNMLIKVWKIF